MRTPSIRRRAAYVAILVALAGVAFGCSGKAKQAATQPGAATKPAGRVIELGPQTLSFTPTRDDLTVRCVVLAVLSSHPVRINDVQAKAWNYLYLKQVGKNQFEL